MLLFHKLSQLSSEGLGSLLSFQLREWRLTGAADCLQSHSSWLLLRAEEVVGGEGQGKPGWEPSHYLSVPPPAVSPK